MNPWELRINRLNQVENERIPVIYVHGFMGSSEDWDFVLKGDEWGAERPFFAVDLPGHGILQTPATPATSAAPNYPSCWFEETSRQLLEVLTSLRIEKAIWVGYSLGGRISMDFASRNPSYVHALVLESSHPGLSDESDRLQRIKHDLAWARRIRSEWPSILNEWYQQPVFNLDERLLPALYAKRSRQDPRALAAALDGFSLGRQECFEPGDYPCLYLAGSKDHKFVRVGTDFRDRFPSLILKVIEGAGHNVHLERPEQYLEAITQFVKQDLS